jgi:hypothetical protein
MRITAAGIVAGLALFSCASAAFAQAQPPTDQIIVKWRDGSSSTAAAVGTRMQKLGSSTGMRLQRKQQIGTATDVLQLDRALDQGEMMATAGRTRYPTTRCSSISGTSRAPRSARRARIRRGT